MGKPFVVIDNKIPFIKGRLEKNFETLYLSPSEIDKESVKNADALLVRTRTKCNKDLLEGSDVKLVATGTVGMDHIDSSWCEANGITPRNSAGCNAPGVAQYVWSMLLRNGFDISKDTLGIVGYGNIGSIVAEWGDKFGCKTLICDPPKERENYGGERYVTLRQLLEESDAVTLHVPLTKNGTDKTFHMIGEKELQLMKPQALLINAARGGVIDEGALLESLKESKIRAILDVWENEPNINQSLLSYLKGYTPHIAGYSRQGKERATRMVLEALEEYFGLPTDKSGLEERYRRGEIELTPQIVMESFDPAIEMKKLIENPDNFEEQRETYVYRNEVGKE